MTFKYYRVGSKFRATIGDRSFTVACDDITTHQREVEGPAFFWINPPFRVGSLREFQRMAAQTTHGIKHVEMDSIYFSIAKMIRDGDEFVWSMPATDPVVSFFEKLDLKSFKWIKNAGGGTAHLAYSDGLIGKISVTPSSVARFLSNDTAKSFSVLFPNGIPGFRNIFDPCAGSNPLMNFAMKNGMGYYGVEPNSFKAFNLMLLKKLVRSHHGDITELPDAVMEVPSGIIEGAPIVEKYQKIEDMRDFSEGRIIGRVGTGSATGKRGNPGHSGSAKMRRIK